MKQQIIHILIFTLLTMAFPFHSSGINKEIDFNFPQDVSKEALTDLDKALKGSDDGQLLVDALVRYSIAQSGISQENMPDIVSRIEAVIAKEKRPHIRALLYHLEAMAYSAYRDRYVRWGKRNNPVEETPTDITEWDRSQFNRKIIELVDLSMSNRDALKQVAVTELPGIIKCNQLGAAFVPTLLEFMSVKGIEMLSSDEEFMPVKDMITDQWVKETEDNAPAHIYAITKANRHIGLEDYRKYQDSEYSALLLQRLAAYDNKEQYQLLNEYVSRYPNAIFTPEIKNMILDLEDKTVSVKYPRVLSPTDSIKLDISVTNANSFNVNVYRIPDNLLQEYTFSPKSLKLISSHPMTVKGEIPFSDNNVKTSLPPLPYGAYIITADDLNEGKSSSATLDLHKYDILRVTDMALIVITNKSHNDRVAAVNVMTGKPIPGASIGYESDNGAIGNVGTTNANGILSLPRTFIDNKNTKRAFNNLYVSVSKQNDKYGLPLRYYQFYDRGYSNDEGTIYTDLGVYRPGETVNWAAVAYQASEGGRAPLAEREFEIIFTDHNREPIDTIKAVSDAFGRIEGSFLVPKDRMNGKFFITMYECNASYREQIARTTVNVSEYKTPTFEISFPDARRSYTSGQPVKVSGKVETYSGMPVANTTVRLSLILNEWSWWWWRNNANTGEHLMDTTVTTDAQGLFSFSYQPELFRENNGDQPGRHGWARYNYQVVATVTSNAGETQEEFTSFIVGTRRGIELGKQNGNVFFNDKPIKLPLTFNTTDEVQTSVWCTWEIIPIDKKEPVKTGNLNTADPTIDLTSLPSGTYLVKVHILDADKGEQDVDAETTITLYRKGDKTPPVKDTPLWISPIGQSVDNRNIAHITAGVSVPQAHIYYVASTTDKVLSEGWLNYTRGMHDFTIALPKQAGADVNVKFITYYDKLERFENVNITNPYKAEALSIKATSFRDKLTPGDMEHWTFSITDQNDKPIRAAMLLDMYDKAIASIAPNDWRFNNWRPSGSAAELNITSLGGNNYTHAHWMAQRWDTNDGYRPIIPYLYTYNQYLFSHYLGRYEEQALGARPMRGDVMLARAPMASKETAMLPNSMDGEGEVKSEEAIADAAVEVEVNEKDLNKVQLRESDVKTALWMPLLTSDDKGNVQVEFEVPNFNTTWITQAVAWNEHLVGSRWLAEVLTQKPLMVRSSMPRFLRQGDKATLAATVQNATDEATACDAVIELFDPRSGDIFASRKFNLQLDGNGSQAVTIDWVVPDTAAMVGFRIKAANSSFGDGEQVMVPVLTTISPVIETEPFYIEAAQSHYETMLPRFPKDARVTLEYCDNPVWYCVLALPTIFKDNYQVATQAAHSLFALQIAQGVAKSQPQIKEAVSYWKQHNEDSTLVSMLQKNQDLKIGTLLASPWMREADRQTLRMSKLNELFDDAIVNQEYEKIIAALQSLQMSDGGFTWFRYPDCKSNVWTTGSVLELIGEIKNLGFLPDDSRLTSMINRAVAYYDSENVRLFNLAKKYNKEPYSEFTSYAYTRTLFPEVKQQSSASTSLFKNVVKYMNKKWDKGLTVKQKAFYALTLNRNGYQKTASNIIESIRQFAIVKPSLGMYWDNLQTSYGWWELDKVAYTCAILNAMNEVDPRQEEIDQVRKWMLLMKQSNDWGSYSLASDAVYSILSTGSQWLERSAMPTITVAGQPIQLDQMAQWLGYFRTTVPASTVGDVIIDRSGKGPAWGAIYSQYKAPMAQIQEKAIEEVSISKEYYVYAQDGSLHSATSFNVGDKVKVRVVIKTNKDMDFVTITDERAACFEPVDQLSGYRSEDRTWFYQETKDTQTNVFITSLDKGTHIIGYDVWVTNPGEFTSGIATIQCQYAPQLSAHSAGRTITVLPKE